MFKAICFRPESGALSKFPVDLGFVVEAMIFYSDITVVANKAVFSDIMRTWGAEVTLEMLRQNFINIQYELELTGIQTKASGQQKSIHSGVIFHAPKHEFQKIAPEILEEVIGKRGKGRRMANRFSEYIKNIEKKSDIIKTFNLEVKNSNYTRTVASAFVEMVAPEYKLPKNLIFDLRDEVGGFSIETNIDFNEVNKFYHNRVSPKHSTISPEYILSHLLKGTENLNLAAKFGCDIAVGPMDSKILSMNTNRVIQQTKKNMDEIGKFQEFIFEQGRSIREAVNSGEKSANDVLKLLEDARKFKTWIKDKPHDIDLLKEYFKEVTKASWIDKLPTKAMRWTIFAGIGLGIDSLGAGGWGTAAGLSISAADSFVLDKIIGGWKPNHFIDNSLKPFVEKK